MIPRPVSVWFEDDGERVVINLPDDLRLDLSVATRAAEDLADTIRQGVSVGREVNLVGDSLIVVPPSPEHLEPGPPHPA